MTNKQTINNDLHVEDKAHQAVINRTLTGLQDRYNLNHR
jgi:hypothetical protein